MRSASGLSLKAALLAGGWACGDSGAPNPPPPSVTVTAVSPAAGPPTGGTTVTITGTNFTNVTSVTIGGSELGSRAVVSASQITGTTPSSATSGAKDVVVTSSSHGSGTCTGCFSYADEEPSALRFVALTLGSVHTCGLTPAGAVYCWGDNQQGQLGDGTTTARTVPTRVVGEVTFASISAGGAHTCGLTAEGTAHCWGANRYAQLGVGTVTGPENCREQGNSPCSRVPLPVAGGLTFVSLSIAGGTAGHTCGLTADGAAYCWGQNQTGSLGIGTSGPDLCPADSPPKECSTVPLPVTGGLRFASVSIGGGHTCGLTAAGAGHCWGFPGFEERVRLTPEPVPGGLSFAMVRVSISHLCGLTAAGDGYCWGYNRFGRLGDGSPEATIRLNPGLIVGGLKFSAISVSSYQSCALTTTGAAYCWGHNGGGSQNGGALGDGTTIDRFTPVPVVGGLTFTVVTVGTDHSCGITVAGVTYCWGGVLGDGTSRTSTVPVKVAGQ